MATPSDPAKRAAYLARKAKNQRDYVARQRAAKASTPPSNVTGRYQQSRKAGYVSGQGIAERAAREAYEARERRAAVIKSLPDIRNPGQDVTIRVPEAGKRGLNIPERRTREGFERQAKRLRDAERASKLQAVGKARQSQLRWELAENDQVHANLATAENRARFQELSERIAKTSQQALALLFNHLEGQGDYNSAIERVIGSPKSRDVEEALQKLEALADRADQAELAYSPKAIGKLRV